MKSTVSFSRALTRDNIKRYWIIPAIGLVAYLVDAVIPVVLNFSNFADVSDYSANMMLFSGGGLPMVIDVCMAIAMSIAVFSYMHQKPSSMMIHAMPVTRTRLYLTNVIGGFVMIGLPVLITGIAMLPLGAASSAKPLAPADTYGSISSAAEVFNPATCFRWVLLHLVIMAFIFAVANLMAVITGTRVIHALLTGFALMILQGLAGMTNFVLNNFMIGYSSESANAIMYWFNPATAISFSHGRAAFGYMFMYLGIALVITLAGLLLYRCVKLERVGDACLFPRVADLICLLLTFVLSVPASLIGSELLTGSANGSKLAFLLMMLIFSAIFYMISRMIADGTTRVLTASNCRKFGITIIVFAVFCCFTVFDLTGFSQKIPETSDVAKVSIDADSMMGQDFTTSDKAVIEKLGELQRGLIAEEPFDVNDMGDDAEWAYSMTFRYQLRGGGTVVRQYTLNYVPGSDVVKALYALYDEKAFREAICVDIAKYGGVKHATAEISDVEGVDYVELGGTETAALVKEYNKDVMNLDSVTAKKMYDSYYTDGNYSVVLDGKVMSDQMTITPVHKKTLKWIRENSSM